MRSAGEGSVRRARGRRRRSNGSRGARRWDGERGERGDRGAGRLGEPRVHLQHLPQRPPPLRLPPPIRGHDEEQAGVAERETRRPGAEAGGAGSPSEQRHHQPLRFQQLAKPN